MKTEDAWQANTRTEESVRNADGAGLGVETDMTTRLRTKAELEQESGLMEAVCERGNLMLAYQRVVENKGAAGVDGIGVAEFKDHLKGISNNSPLFASRRAHRRFDLRECRPAHTQRKSDEQAPPTGIF